MSMRATILADIKACLESITEAKGFALTVASVKRGVREIDQVKVRPALVFFTESRDVRGHTNQTREADLHLWVSGFADAPADDFTELDQLITATEKALSDRNYNPHWSRTSIDKDYTFEDSSERPIGVFHLKVSVNYEYATDAP